MELGPSSIPFSKKKKPLSSNFGAKLKLGSIFGKKKGQTLTWF
jgi:hypothetical protein